jgi:putative transposase
MGALRFSIIGPLLAAPPGRANCALPSPRWRPRPGAIPRPAWTCASGVSTLERWYYAARRAADPSPFCATGRANGRFPSLSAGRHYRLDRPVPRASRAGPCSCTWTTCARACKAGSGSRPCRPTHRAPLPQGPGHVPPGRPKRSSDGARGSPGSARATGGAQLRGRARLGTLAPGLPPRSSRKVLTRAGAWVKPMLLGSSTTARAWSATCSGIWTRPPEPGARAVARPS